MELTEETPNLLLTWVDLAGEFHTGVQVADVPSEYRSQVRIVVTKPEQGTGDLFYVADLTHANAAGHYSVRSMPRGEWELLGAEKRATRLEALRPHASPPSAPPKTELDPTAAPTLVVYGAPWCGACRDAKQYLAKLGIKVLEKDIDSSDAVALELKAKLRRAGLPPTSSIPVIDIDGRLLVGFNARAIDDALRAHQESAEL